MTIRVPIGRIRDSRTSSKGQPQDDADPEGEGGHEAREGDEAKDPELDSGLRKSGARSRTLRGSRVKFLY